MTNGSTSSTRQNLLFVVTLSALLLVTSCGKKASPSISAEQAQQQTAPAAHVSSPEEPPAPSNDVALPIGFGRHTGDLDEMVKRRNIRALVILSPIGFFYNKGQPKG
jgi:hypothetical protein